MHKGKQQMKFFKMATVTAALVVSTNSNAALIERLGGLAYYDDVADLTWLADANYSATQFASSGGTEGDADGRMIAQQSKDWAAGLTIDGVDGWRLPSNSNSCLGYGGDGCTSEMSDLFHNVLGGEAGYFIGDIHNANYDLFSNVSDSWYWFGTAVPGHSMDDVFAFLMDGYTDTNTFLGLEFAWAVHSGDVSAVPIPAAVWLFGSGLIGLAGVARCKKT